VVVGAGVVGVTSAYRLAQAGAEVTVVDGGRVGGGATGATFAHVNASYAGYWDYVELRRAGLDGYGRLAQEPGGARWWHQTGYLSVHRSGSGFDDHDQHLSRLQRMGYPAVQVDAEPNTVEPALARFTAARSYSFPAEGYVDLQDMLADLLARCRRLGAEVRTGDPVIAVMTSGNDVTGVRLRSGATLECDGVIVCSGRWTDQLLALAGVESQFVAHDEAGGTPVPGLLVVTEAVPGSVTRVSSVDDVNCRPDGQDRTMLWSALVDRELQRLGGPEADPDAVDRLAGELLAAASTHVPALRAARVHRTMVTMRAMPADGLPIVGPLPGAAGLYVMLAHAAVTLAPVLADVVVSEVAHQRSDSRLDRFRPGRLIPDVATAPDTRREKEVADDLATKR
jgi:glycine/D-amino acid oxidase-like deaminating enzyme